MTKEPRATPLVRHLSAFGAALLVPVLLSAALLLWQYAGSERVRIEAQVREKARALVTSLDRALDGQQAALQALALSPSLRTGDLGSFYSQAAEVARQRGGVIALRQASGRQLLNTAVPLGTPLPDQSAPADAAALETNRPVVSDLLTGAISKQPIFGLVMAVPREGAPPYLLSLALTSSFPLGVLSTEALPQGWTASYVDRNGMIAARSSRAEEFVGRPASEDLRRNAVGEAGSWAGMTVSGEPVIAAYMRSRLSGWIAAVGAPISVVQAPLHRSLWLLAALGATTLLLSTLLAYFFGGRIAKPMRRLAGTAAALGRGESVPALRTRVREIEEVADALIASAQDARAREAALRESETRFRAMADSAPALIWTTDEEGHVTFANRYYEDFFGRAASEILDDGWRQIVLPSDLEHFSSAFFEAFGARRIFKSSVRVRDRRGEIRWLRCEGVPRFAADGTFLGYVGCNVDVTEAKLGEAALVGAKEELEARVAERTRELEAQIAEREKAEAALLQSQKMEAIGRLTGGVAHDFNNLLTIIIGRIERMRQHFAPSEPRWLKDLDAVSYAADRAALLTHRLLAFSRQQPLEAKVIEPNKLVSGLSELLRQTLGEVIAVEVVLAGGLWKIRADPNQLENALLNLAVNARDAMREGGRLTIETSNSYLDEAYAAEVGDGVKPGQYVVICVSDTGTGMPPEVIAKAFDPFFTTKPQGEGTGLGLSMVYGFARQSGGHAKIYSEPGHGTTVKIYLPRIFEAAEPAATRDNGARMLEAPDGSASGTVLVVEDEEQVRRFSADSLRELGYRVIEACDGAEGLRCLEADPAIALLFTDVGLPGALNGRTLADEARRRRPDLKVLFTTGYARNAIVHHGRLDPGVELLTKPFTHLALAQKVRSVLHGIGG